MTFKLMALSTHGDTLHERLLAEASYTRNSRNHLKIKFAPLSSYEPFQYTIVLPDVGGDELDAVIGILYGAAITVSPTLAPKIHALADMLGISVDLVR